MTSMEKVGARSRRTDRVQSTLRMSTYFVPGAGINQEVITTDVCRYLGNDALVKPGNYQIEATGETVQGYYVTAYRAFTQEQLADLKADSYRWQQELLRNPAARQGYTPRDSNEARGSGATISSQTRIQQSESSSQRPEASPYQDYRNPKYLGNEVRKERLEATPYQEFRSPGYSGNELRSQKPEASPDRDYRYPKYSGNEVSRQRPEATYQDNRYSRNEVRREISEATPSQDDRNPQYPSNEEKQAWWTCSECQGTQSLKENRCKKCQRTFDSTCVVFYAAAAALGAAAGAAGAMAMVAGAWVGR